MTFLKMLVGIVSANVATGTQQQQQEQPEHTRGHLPMVGMFGILGGNYARQLRPVKKALVVVDPQWCKYNSSRAEKDVIWIKFVNRLVKDFLWNDVFFTMESNPREHVSFVENLKNANEEGEVMLTYDEETGAVCRAEIDDAQVDNIFTSDCQSQTMEIPQHVRSIQNACAIGSRASSDNDVQATSWLPSIWVPPGAAVLKRGTKAHVGSQNIFEDSFTRSRRMGGNPVDVSMQSTDLEFFANVSETAQIFFVGADPVATFRSAMEARRRGFKTVVLYDAVQRSLDEPHSEWKETLAAHDIQVHQWISDDEAYGESFFQNNRDQYEMLAPSAFAKFSFEFSVTPDEFSPVEDSFYPLVWILVGVLVGGVIVGSLVAAYYMKRVNPKVAEEKRQEGIVRTRSGQ